MIMLEIIIIIALINIIAKIFKFKKVELFDIKENDQGVIG